MRKQTIADLANQKISRATQSPEDETSLPVQQIDPDKIEANNALQVAMLSPAGFAMYASNGEWKPAKHLALLNEKLMDMATRKIKRLVVSMPPRHGKSELISKYLPAWIAGALREKVIITSYEADFASEWCVKARELVQEYGQSVFDCKIKDTVNKVDHWETTKGGVMYSAGVGGPLTGKGAQWIIIDDPIKNNEEANSAAAREKADDWFKSTVYTRLEPDAVIIIMMTRWHEDDLIGRRLEQEPDEWEIIDFPAIAFEEDALGRKPGEALWPERFDVPVLKKIEETLGQRWFSAMYQQRPVTGSGNKILHEWWNWYDEPPTQFERIVVSWDTAWGIKERNDYSVSAVWGATKNGYYLLEVLRDRVEFPTLLDWAHDFSSRYLNCLHLVEDAVSGTPLTQMLRRDTDYPVKPQRVSVDKEARLNAVIHMIEAGLCHLPTKAPWLQEFLDEHRRFPGSRKDQVDTTSLVLAHFGEIYPTVIRTESRFQGSLKESRWTMDEVKENFRVHPRQQQRMLRLEQELGF